MVIAGPAADTSANGVVRKNLIRVVDGRGSFIPEETTGPSFLVEAFLPDLTHTSGEQKQYLRTLGFRLSCEDGAGTVLIDSGQATAGGAGTTSNGSPTADDPGGRYKTLVSQPFDRVLVEGCCEPGSLLQTSTVLPWLSSYPYHQGG